MLDTHSQMAKALADSITASVSAPGTFSLGGQQSTITNGGFAYSNTAITNNGVATGTLGPYTVSTGYSQPWVSNSINPKIQLNGEGADIEVNGESLIGMIKKIEERLNILHPDAKLEAEWAELRELGNRYRELEQHIKDKQATWDRLKAMPPAELK
jgi:hypothetical protein